MQSDIDPHQSHEEQVCLLSVGDILRGMCHKKFSLAVCVCVCAAGIFDDIVLLHPW